MSATARQFQETMATLSAIYRVELTAPALRGYAQALKHLSISQIREACAKAIRNCKFFPTPSEILSFADCPNEKAESAWATFNDAVDRVGGTKSIRFADPIINHAVNRLGGWRYLADSHHTLKDWNTWIKRDFLKAYKSGLDSDHLNQRRLLGRHDARNGHYKPITWGADATAIEHKPEPVAIVEQIANQKTL